MQYSTIPLRHQKSVSNHIGLRKLSDWIDELMGWTGEKKATSLVRGVAHGTVHILFGLYKLAFGNR